ncbi:MAG: UDP-4-amino-4,6-dideoxy-N-acetyl-beta-L-altrosamine transaminase [Psychrilyobacter sp.]|uniref:UDP-4-amino-4, 6-dideoxy-N-acetyl-beta-L-altrosamine transaminase n=1 Tax=Psychrilyobacter sp. TaxID=2586924 RepID=UPI003C7933C2
MKPISYGRQFIDKKDIEAVLETLQSDYMTQGPKVQEFEERVAKYHNCKYAVAVSNGTAALHAAYYAVGLEKGDEFITSPITFAASANGALYLEGIPKFVDIDKDNYNLDIKKLEEAITDKTKVVTPVSFAGYPVDLKKIREIADKYNLKIIHDAAHAIGSKRDGNSIVDYADATILSFHPVKHVATGEGGMVLTNDVEVYKKLLLFRTHGITKNQDDLIENHGPWYYEMQELGYNYRITDMQCALGITQMEKLNKSIFNRNKIAKFYEEQFKDLKWLELPTNYFTKEWIEEEKYKNLEGKPKNLNSYHLFPVKVKDKNIRLEFFNYLRKNNIYVQVHYIPVHTMPYYKKQFGYKWGDFPVAEDFYKREVSLPMFPTLSEEELEYIVKIVKEFRNKKC